MPVLIDGNNLMFALADDGVDAGRSMLVDLLARYAESRDEKVTVVFDGRAPRGAEARRLDEPRLTIRFSAARTADDVIADLVDACSAPRRLTVVSTDRAIRRHARRRRCKLLDARTFAADLTAPPTPPPANPEPPAKRRGLTPDDLPRWLDEFGLADDDQ